MRPDEKISALNLLAIVLVLAAILTAWFVFADVPWYADVGAVLASAFLSSLLVRKLLTPLICRVVEGDGS